MPHLQRMGSLKTLADIGGDILLLLLKAAHEVGNAEIKVVCLGLGGLSSLVLVGFARMTTWMLLHGIQLLEVWKCPRWETSDSLGRMRLVRTSIGSLVGSRIDR